MWRVPANVTHITIELWGAGGGGAGGASAVVGGTAGPGGAGGGIADVSRSKRNPANMFQRATIDVAVNVDTVEIHDEFADEAGDVLRGQNTIVADGRAHAASNGFVLTATWRTTRALETVATKNGEVVGRGTYTVSADGRQLTIASNDNQVIVLDRAGTSAEVK